MFKWLDAGIYFKTQIKDKFWLGQYGGFEVMIMENTCYVNATKLCSDDGKMFKNWLANDRSKRLINVLEDQLGHVASDSIHHLHPFISKNVYILSGLKKICHFDCTPHAD